MDLKPGSQDGGSVVVIKNHRQPWWFVTTGVDNAGSLATGERQGSVSLQGEDLLGLNDQWTISQRRSFPLDGSLRDSRTLSGSVSVPFGYWTVTLSGNRMVRHHPIKTLFSTLTSSGTSRSAKVQVDRVMHRDAVSKTLASTSLSVTDTESFLENIRLITGSRRLTADAVTNEGFVYSPEELTVVARELLNSGTLFSDQMSRLYVRDLLVNRKGLIRGTGGVHLAADTAGTKTRKTENRSGKIIAGDHENAALPVAIVRIAGLAGATVTMLAGGDAQAIHFASRTCAFHPMLRISSGKCATLFEIVIRLACRVSVRPTGLDQHGSC